MRHAARSSRHRRRRAALAAILCSTLPASGCYRYAALPAAGQPPHGRELRVELTDAAAAALAPRLGAGVIAVDGRVLTRGADSLVLAATTTMQRTGTTQEWRGEAVALPLSGVARLSERRLDRRRSVALGIALVGGAVLAAAALSPDFSLVGTGRGQTSPPR